MSNAQRFFCAGALAFVAVSCGDTTPGSFTAPSPALPAAPVVASSTYSVSGVISEIIQTGVAPLAGAQVIENTSGRTATTNAQGFYSIAGVDSAASNSLTVSNPGYKSETRPIRVPSTAVGVNFDIQIVREGDIHTVFGVVSEQTATGRVPVVGVQVDVMSCNAVSTGCLYNVFVRTTTDGNGYFSLPGLYGGKNNFVWVYKEGYEPVGMPPIGTCDHCNQVLTLSADTRFDVEVARR